VVGLEGGNLRLPKLASGSSGGWIGENQNAPATQPSFGSVLLQAKKYASLVPISNDLIRRASMSASAVVREDLVADIAQATDLAYIRKDGTDGTPKGLRYLAASANILTAQGSPTVAKVIQDLGGMLQVLMDGNVRMLRPGWIIEPRTWKALFTMLDANANPVFRDELNSGKIFGWPYRITTQIPRTLGAGTETEIYLADFADVILGEATSILVDLSDTAAYHDGTNVVSSYSLDQTVLRAIVETDFNTRHNESIVVLTGVTWNQVGVS
jgi:HK97 family phage major capsid protein